jgi:RNA polymerase sigma-70 factor (sigma-E family)
MWPGSGTLVPGDGEDAERAVVELYGAHYDSLVRLATLLGSDDSTAELIVQDSFVAMHHAWSSLRDNRKALSYLCQAVVRRSRSARRRRHTLDKIASDKPAAEQCSSFPQEGAVVIEAVRALPAPQREVLVLRFYVDMSEGEIASVMGVSRGAVKSHTARAMQSLRLVLEGD